ncbi:arsenate reductase ArsC [Marinicella sp. W31]|uniref:arsenate reductase ArsC n=1 Tax=Marinicella sp. W31 TaxID=3023713 RepID=UPI0037564D82
MKILFVCTHNRCRSILGEAITRQMVDGLVDNQIEVRSAGSQPAGQVHPETIRHLQLRQINSDGLSSQSWDELESFDPDVVITVCDNAANETCPVWMGQAMKVHWGLPDPSKILDEKARQEAFFNVMDVLTKRMQVIIDAEFDSMSHTEKQQLFKRAGELM